MLVLLAGTVAALVAGGCKGATPAPEVRIDTVPSLSDTVADQIWTLGEAVTFRLPFATGGDGPLTYSLGPEMPPGLTFHRDSLKLAGTPTAAGDYPMRYEVADADDNTADVAVLSFRITVQEPAPPDSAPRFAETLDDVTFTVGDAVRLTLPAANGGNPPLSYSREPALPGLPFDPATRELSGMPEAAASYPMIYRVMDGDANTADGDADELRFTITVQPPPEGDFVAVYDAAADDVEVYLISTNPTADPLATPQIATGAAAAPATAERNLAETERSAAAHEDYPVPHHRPEITELNNNPPVPLGGGSASQETAALHQAPPSVGARLAFWAIDLPATPRTSTGSFRRL